MARALTHIYLASSHTHKQTHTTHPLKLLHTRAHTRTRTNTHSFTHPLKLVQKQALPHTPTQNTYILRSIHLILSTFFGSFCIHAPALLMVEPFPLKTYETHTTERLSRMKQKKIESYFSQVSTLSLLSNLFL